MSDEFSATAKIINGFANPNLVTRVTSSYATAVDLAVATYLMNSHNKAVQTSMIHIVDYGMGNLRSVQKAFERLEVEAVICSDASELGRAERVVLPGVGAFRDAIAELRRQDLVRPLKDLVDAGRPLLGICLGQQLLFDVSYEDGEFEGLGFIAGKVVRFEEQPDLKIPHMGWNSLEFAKPSPIYDGIADGSYVYFVHGYHTVPQNEDVIASRCDHGGRFISSVSSGNIYATQFHPEKSQSIGLRLLKNFAELDPTA
jgi:imidazole glycerol-phosphate synthase subunit HisH